MHHVLYAHSDSLKMSSELCQTGLTCVLVIPVQDAASAAELWSTLQQGGPPLFKKVRTRQALDSLNVSHASMRMCVMLVCGCALCSMWPCAVQYVDDHWASQSISCLHVCFVR